MIYTSLQEAIIDINLTKMNSGVIVSKSYISNTGKTETISVVGINSGYGPDFYSFISNPNIYIYSDVITEKEDISRLISGSIYLYQDKNNQVYKRLYYNNGERVEDDLKESFYFYNISENKYLYFSKNYGVIDIDNTLNSGMVIENKIYSGTYDEKTGKLLLEDNVLLMEGDYIIFTNNLPVSENIKFKNLTIVFDYLEDLESDRLCIIDKITTNTIKISYAE